MKKHLTLFAIFATLTMSLAAAPAPAEQQRQWWQARLQQSLLDLENNQLPDTVKQALQKDAARSREMIEIFDNYALGDDNLQATASRISQNQHNATCDEILDRALDIVWLATIVREGNNTERIQSTTSVLEEMIQQEFTRGIGPRAASLATSTTHDMLPQHWQRLATREALYPAVNRHCTLLRERARKELYPLIEEQMTARQWTMTPETHKRLVSTAIDSWLTPLAEEHVNAPISSDIESGWVWHSVKLDLDRRIDLMKQAASFAGKNPDSIDPLLLELYLSDPGKLQQDMFNRLFTSHCDQRPFPHNPARNTDHDLRLNIPDTPDMATLLLALDKVRDSRMKLINGKESEDWFEATRIELQQVCTTALHPASTSFFREEQKLGILEADIPANEKPRIRQRNAAFFSAKSLMQAKQQSATKYIDESLLFLRWVHNLKSPASEICVQTMTSRVKNSISAGHQILKHSAGVAAAAEYELPNMHATLLRLQSPLGDHYKAFALSQSIESQLRARMTPEMIRQAEQNGRETTATLRAQQIRLANDLNQFREARKTILQARRERFEKARALIARQEVDYLRESIQAYLTIHDDMNKARQAFEEYARHYAGLERQARAGIYSNELKSAIESKTLLSQIQGFAPDEIEKEYKTRTWVRQAILRESARLNYLATSYRRAGLVIDNSPAEETLRIQQAVQDIPAAKIASWNMTEGNFRQVDRNAALQLARIRQARVWQQSSDGSNGAADRQEQIDRLGISLRIPDGWDMTTPDEFESKAGIIAVFRNKTDGSCFSVAETRQHTADLSGTTAEWLRQQGRNTVRSGTATHPIGSMRWLLTKNRHNEVMKTYAFEHEGRIIFISGSANRDRYRFLDSRISTVAASIRSTRH